MSPVQGSCTACILMLEGAKLHAANLGDSGFMVIRKNRIVFKSPQQQHQFNFPYQLGGEGTLSDTPAHAEVGLSCFGQCENQAQQQAGCSADI